MRAEVCWCGELGGGCLGVLEIALAPPDQRVSAHLTPRAEEAQKQRGMGLLHAAVPVLLAAVAEVEAGGVGGGAAKVVGFGSFGAFEAHMRAAVGRLPAVLEEELLEQASLTLLYLGLGFRVRVRVRVTSPHNLAATPLHALALTIHPSSPALSPQHTLPPRLRSSTQARCLTSPQRSLPRGSKHKEKDLLELYSLQLPAS